MRFILFVSELKDALWCDSANTLFVVEYMSRQGIAASSHIRESIIGHDLIRSLGIDIHGGDMTIHWDDDAIPWRDIDSTAKDVFALSQHNAPFNAETKRMKRILDAKYSKAYIKTIA